MKLSALIRKLQDIEFDHGDLYVFAPEPYEAGWHDVEKVVVIDRANDTFYPGGKGVFISRKDTEHVLIPHKVWG